MSLNSFEDTIAAIATPLGTGGVGVVRISGENSLDLISKIFSLSIDTKKLPDLQANKIYHGWIKDNDKLIDEVIILVFKAPKSFTGEDIIEIQCHGGINVVKNILNICLKYGARLAERGEFTKRAFLNGNIDLSKAEAILDLINSKTDKFSLACAHNLSGKLASYINDLRSELINLLSIIEASIDFPDDVEEPDNNFIQDKIKFISDKIDYALNTANSSNLMRHGLKVAIAGKPNVGKSSLFNALLKIDRSIVTEIAGTTRDVIQESIDINGIPVILIDTAGIRELEHNHSSDYVESIGINITKSYIKEADLILFVYDLTKGLTKGDLDIYEEIKDKPVIKLASKLDLFTGELKDNEVIAISSKNNIGFDKIKQKIQETVFSGNLSGDAEFSTNIRQQECLAQAKESLSHALNSCEINSFYDFISIDLKSALISLGEITGEVVSDEIINNIFNNFCIGK